MLRVCWFVPLSVKIICLPCCLYKSSVVDTFTVFIAFFPHIDLWLFANKFCLEIVVAYCLSGLGFQKEIFLFCLNLSINLV